METEEEKEKLHRIEDMKSRLFSKSYSTLRIKHSGTLHKKEYDVADTWKEEKEENIAEKIFMKTSIFKKFFIFSICFFVLAVVFALYNFIGGGNTVSNDNIDIVILGNTFTAGGEDLPLQIEITNKNNAALELADLVVEYPKGSFADLSQDSNKLRDSLGTIPAGQVKSDNLKVVLFGEQGSIRPIKVSLEYRVEGSNAIFVKEKDYSVSISSAPIDLAVNAPDTITPNQDITFNIKATLNSTKSATSLLFKADYPPGFMFKSAKPAPTIDNNVWDLGDLSPGSESNISITGNIVGAQDGEQKTFHFFTGSKDENDKANIGVIFNSLGHTILINKPFIQARLLVNGVYQNEYASDSKTNISGQIQWTNNLDTKITDMVITAKIYGNALDRQKINVFNGNFDSINNIIVWDKNSNKDFSEVNPGNSGVVFFDINPLPLFSSNGLLIDPSIHIDISISGKQPLQGNIINSLTDSESKIIKIMSDVSASVKALHFIGAFANTGDIPLKAEKETTYTIVWNLSNTANIISNAKMSATLPAFVRFVGPVDPASEDVKYDETTKQVTWNIGAIPKGAGISGNKKEVSFQIGFTPSLSQVGQIPILINDAILTGHDDFANVDVHINKSALDSKIMNDPSFVRDSERVIQ
ncbi:MAG: hypothetical protein NT068_03820 [Candidatus Nomurabacteria bacterium]|nr:hypothetical protein [Candidatus Nomurabacteria bacterium]